MVDGGVEKRFGRFFFSFVPLFLVCVRFPSLLFAFSIILSSSSLLFSSSPFLLSPFSFLFITVHPPLSLLPFLRLLMPFLCLLPFLSLHFPHSVLPQPSTVNRSLSLHSIPSLSLPYILCNPLAMRIYTHTLILSRFVRDMISILLPYPSDWRRLDLANSLLTCSFSCFC